MLPTRPSTSYPKRMALSGRCDAVMDGTGWVLVLMAFTAALAVGLTVRDIRRSRRRASQTSGGCGSPTSQPAGPLVHTDARASTEQCTTERTE